MIKAKDPNEYCTSTHIETCRLLGFTSGAHGPFVRLLGRSLFTFTRLSHRCNNATSRLPFKNTLEDFQATLLTMALDPRAFPGIASETRPKSSASTPSLRSRDSEVMSVGRSTPDVGGGNVKVVVRVRAFLPRGTSIRWDNLYLTDALYRNRKGCRMHY